MFSTYITMMNFRLKTLRPTGPWIASDAANPLLLEVDGGFGAGRGFGSNFVSRFDSVVCHGE